MANKKHLGTGQSIKRVRPATAKARTPHPALSERQFKRDVKAVAGQSPTAVLQAVLSGGVPRRRTTRQGR